MGGVLQHGHAKYRTSTYQSWRLMRQRCNNRKNAKFKNYGARGITVCEQWNSFANFLKDMGERPQGMTIERMKNDGNYEPSNCRWATQKEQQNNRRDNILIWTGETYCTMKQFAEAIGMPCYYFRRLYRDRNKSIEDILLQEGCLF